MKVNENALLAARGAKVVDVGLSILARSSRRSCTGAPVRFALTAAVNKPVDRTSKPSSASTGAERST
jgi:hypothetical protein